MLASVPGDKNVDVQKLCQVIGVNYLQLASPREVKEIAELEVGGIRPFLLLSTVKYVLDAECLEKLL